MAQYISSSCGRCGKPVQREATHCPHCGVYFSGEKMNLVCI